MKFRDKLKDIKFRDYFIELICSLLTALLLLFLCVQLHRFVQLTQETSERFKRSHSHLWDHSLPKETPYYDCKCQDHLSGMVVCLGCVTGESHAIVPDTPEQTFERVFSEMLVIYCPASVTVDDSYCHEALQFQLRIVLYIQEKVLSLLVPVICGLLYLIYLYMFPYRIWHNLLNRNSALTAAKGK